MGQCFFFFYLLPTSFSSTNLLPVALFLFSGIAPLVACPCFGKVVSSSIQTKKGFFVSSCWILLQENLVGSLSKAYLVCFYLSLPVSGIGRSTFHEAVSDGNFGDGFASVLDPCSSVVRVPPSYQQYNLMIFLLSP